MRVVLFESFGDDPSSVASSRSSSEARLPQSARPSKVTPVAQPPSGSLSDRPLSAPGIQRPKHAAPRRPSSKKAANNEEKKSNPIHAWNTIDKGHGTSRDEDEYLKSAYSPDHSQPSEGDPNRPLSAPSHAISKKSSRRKPRAEVVSSVPHHSESGENLPFSLLDPFLARCFRFCRCYFMFSLNTYFPFFFSFEGFDLVHIMIFILFLSYEEKYYHLLFE